MMETSPFQAVQAEKISQQISQQILESIIDGHYPPGGRLPSERKLAEIFEVSRVTVREALSELASKGVVCVKQGLGTTVNPINEWSTFDPSVLKMLHGDEVFDQLTEMRLIIEPELAALAAARITADGLDRLRPLARLSEDDTVEEHVERDSSFHTTIARATGNSVLLTVFLSVDDLLRESRRRSFVVPGEITKAGDWHQRILAAIEDHDSDGARQAMASHLEQVSSALERYSSERLEAPN